MNGNSSGGKKTHHLILFRKIKENWAHRAEKNSLPGA